MATLLLRLEGALQAWGTESRFAVRDTGQEPSKSGVIGLICCALGMRRDETRVGSVSLEALASLVMGVRVDHEGRLARDYQTALDVYLPGKKPKATEPSTRYYLADASFLVGLEGQRELLQEVDRAVASPTWPLFLGRRAFVPSVPVHVRGGLVDADLEAALRGWPLTLRKRDPRPESIRFVVESADGPDVRRDVPLSFVSHDRRYATRRTKTVFEGLDKLKLEEEAPCTSPG